MELLLRENSPFNKINGRFVWLQSITQSEFDLCSLGQKQALYSEAILTVFNNTKEDLAFWSRVGVPVGAVFKSIIFRTVLDSGNIITYADLVTDAGTFSDFGCFINYSFDSNFYESNYPVFVLQQYLAISSDYNNYTYHFLDDVEVLLDYYKKSEIDSKFLDFLAEVNSKFLGYYEKFEIDSLISVLNNKLSGTYSMLEVDNKLKLITDNNYIKSEIDLKIQSLLDRISLLETSSNTSTVNSNTKIDETQYEELKEILKALSLSMLGGGR